MFDAGVRLVCANVKIYVVMDTSCSYTEAILWSVLTRELNDTEIQLALATHIRTLISKRYLRLLKRGILANILLHDFLTNSQTESNEPTHNTQFDSTIPPLEELSYRMQYLINSEQQQTILYTTTKELLHLTIISATNYQTHGRRRILAINQ